MYTRQALYQTRYFLKPTFHFQKSLNLKKKTDCFLWLVCVYACVPTCRHIVYMHRPEVDVRWYTWSLLTYITARLSGWGHFLVWVSQEASSMLGLHSDHHTHQHLGESLKPKPWSSGLHDKHLSTEASFQTIVVLFWDMHPQWTSNMLHGHGFLTFWVLGYSHSLP